MDAPVLLDWPLVGRAADLDRVAAALARPECSGVVLLGPGGVGKTRLANECLALAEQSGFSTARAIATRSTSAITLGALAPLLPDLGDRTVNLLGAAREALAARAGGRPMVLFVDDAHLLDEVSAALLLQIAADPHLFVLVTVRTGEEVSDAITALWKDGAAERVDLDPLSDLDVDELMIEALGGRVEPPARTELLRVSAGNPLALRELLLGAVADGTLVEADGRWRLAGALGVSARLQDLVAERLDTLAPAAYAALEIIALGEPLGLGLFEHLADAGAIEELEQRGLVRMRADERRLEAWLAHPLYGEVVRSRLGVMRTRTILRRLADALEAQGAKRRGDLLRIATWRLESGTAANIDVLVAAARSAFVVLDMDLACRLADAAWSTERRFDAGLLLGHVLSELGAFDDAEAVLTEVEVLARTDEERVLVTMSRSENLFRMERPGEAIAVTMVAEEEVGDADWRAELTGHRATFEMLLGRTDEALELVGPAIEGDAVRPLIQGAIAAATTLVWDGRPETALELAERAYAAHLEVWEHELFQSDPGIHAVSIIMALTQSGRLDEAEGVQQLAWQAANEQGAVQAMAWFALLGGMLHEVRGRPLTAHDWYRRSAGWFRMRALDGRAQWALHGATLSCALLGRVDDAAGHWREVEAIDTCIRLNHVLADDARAWLLAARGDLEGARDLVDRAADEGLAGASSGTAMTALHTLARLGAPERAAARMAEVASTVEGRLLRARADHVAALATGEPEPLAAVADELEDLGALLLAAEAQADAARALRRAGRARQANAATQRAGSLAARCEGAMTPALVLVEERTPLTRREREVALLAASGMPSKAIADQLFLSVRTVENHLQRVYEKLGIGGRDELAEVMGADA